MPGNKAFTVLSIFDILLKNKTLTSQEGTMAIIYNKFLRDILHTYDLLNRNTEYPFFDPTCRRYEAIRAALTDKKPLASVFEKFGITEYQYRQALATFREGVSLT